MSQFIQVSGAYGRDYKSKAAVLDDWQADRDFTIRDIGFGGRYINRQDADLAGLTVIVYYDSDRRQTQIKPNVG